MKILSDDEVVLTRRELRAGQVFCDLIELLEYEPAKAAWIVSRTFRLSPKFVTWTQDNLRPPCT